MSDVTNEKATLSKIKENPEWEYYEDFIGDPEPHKCPVCGEPVDCEYTRIVGFYTPIKTWSQERTAEYKMRRWEEINKTSEAV